MLDEHSITTGILILSTKFDVHMSFALSYTGVMEGKKNALYGVPSSGMSDIICRYSVALIIIIIIWWAWRSWIHSNVQPNYISSQRTKQL